MNIYNGAEVVVAPFSLGRQKNERLSPSLRQMRWRGLFLFSVEIFSLTLSEDPFENCIFWQELVMFK